MIDNWRVGRLKLRILSVAHELHQDEYCYMLLCWSKLIFTSHVLL